MWDGVAQRSGIPPQMSPRRPIWRRRGTAVLAEVPTGAVADRLGRKASLALGVGCTAVAVLIFGLATSYEVVLVSYVAWAIGIAFFSGADQALLFESLKALGREDE